MQLCFSEGLGGLADAWPSHDGQHLSDGLETMPLSCYWFAQPFVIGKRIELINL